MLYKHTVLNIIKEHGSKVIEKHQVHFWKGLSFFFLSLVLIWTVVVPVQAQGIYIPSGSEMNVATGQLSVSGYVDIGGTLSVDTGSVSTSGNWSNSGVFTPGTGTVYFNGTSAATQVLNSGGMGTNYNFYNIAHDGASTVQLSTHALDINNNLLNSCGSINANGQNITVAGSWTNAATFTHGSATVTFDGTDQNITGDTIFYNLMKTTAASNTMTFTNADEQIIEGTLTLSGASGQLLNLRSDSTNDQWYINLRPGGAQALQYLDVQDSNAFGITGGGDGVTLVAGGTSNNQGNNNNWVFGGATLTWQGDVSANWNIPGNWDLGFVPGAADTAFIPTAPLGGILPTLSASVDVTDLTLQTDAAVFLAGYDLQVTNAVQTEGTVYLFGNETLTIASMNNDSGIFNFTGDSDGISEIFVLSSLTYYDVVINDPDATNDTFLSATDISIAGNLTITASEFDISTNTNTLTVAGTISVDDAILRADNGHVDANGDVELIHANSELRAPGNGQSFTVSGDFSHTNGTFTHNNGVVTFNGSNQSINGSTTFYDFNKTVASADTLTFDRAATQTITNSLVLQGALGNILDIESDLATQQFAITLQAGATQTLSYLEVRDSAGSGGIGLVARNASEPNGNNDNWFFSGASITWEGDDVTTPTDWETAANWDLGIVPTTDDTAVIADVSEEPLLTAAASVDNLTLLSAATVTLSGYDMTVANMLSNEGTIYARGDETVNINTMDTDSGDYVYTGDGDGAADTFIIANTGTSPSMYYNLQVHDTNATSDTFRTVLDLTVNHNLNVTDGELDISGNGSTLTQSGTLTINGGVFRTTNGTVDINGSVVLSSGIFFAPATGQTFTISADFINSGGTFTHNSGLVVFDTTNTSTVTGNTTFYDFQAAVGGKSMIFGGISNQTVENTLTMSGASGNLMTIQSTNTGVDQWELTATNSTQSTQFLDLADGAASGNDVYCFSCTNSGNNDDLAASPHWIFMTLSITNPESGKTVDTTPTIIGVGPTSQTITFRDIANNLIATTDTDVNGNYRVEVDPSDALTTGANSITPYIGALSGGAVPLAIADPTTPAQVPIITSHIDQQRVSGATVTVAGQGASGDTVTVMANDADGNMLLQTVGSGSTDGAGDFSFALTTDLLKGENYLSVTVDGVASGIVPVLLTDPFGVVFDSSSDGPVNSSIVSLYRASDNQLANAADGDIHATDTNPYTTAADGFYSFLTANGDYYLEVNVAGYDYPSTEVSFPAGRTIVTGSKGETFTVSSVVIEMDHPADPNAQILRIAKDANKGEVTVGEVVTYTMTIENISSNNISNVYLKDIIPPGFKYLEDRVMLDGVPISNPSGNRPLLFFVDSCPSGVTRVLKYQLIVGAGVIPGNYDNSAIAQFSNGKLLSNRTTETVRVVLDPLFDLGMVIGKVFFDKNDNGIQDAPQHYWEGNDEKIVLEEPIPNVQIVMEDGTVIKTDAEGRFSVQSIIPGRHLFRIDERSLPEGSYLTTEKVVVIDVKEGMMHKVNFGVNLYGDQVFSEDRSFFTQNVKVALERNKPHPRLNVRMFEEEVGVLNNVFIHQVEFRVFCNYISFINTWTLEILDWDTHRLIKSFSGNHFTLHDPIFWDGLDLTGEHIRIDRRYGYRVIVSDKRGKKDVTKIIPLNIKKLKTDAERQAHLLAQEKAREDYMKWLEKENKQNQLKEQHILIEGETLTIERLVKGLQNISIYKGGSLVAELPILEKRGISASDLLDGEIVKDAGKTIPLEVILPYGDYDIIAQSTEASPSSPPQRFEPITGSVSGGVFVDDRIKPSDKVMRSYRKAIKVGEDYMFFVALGDALAGYSFMKGKLDVVEHDDKYNDGFWVDGKMAYFLQGKIKGKYLITSSFDTDRDRKALFKKIEKDKYYPVYGDSSTVDYQATNTQGPLYLLVEWDKSSVLWGNYSIGFDETEFAQFSRTLYGGKVDFESLSSTEYGESRTKAVVFRAQAQQKSAHNELLSTGGSLYYLKHKDIIQGSDKVLIEVRDKITGLVRLTKEMEEGVDYEMDYDEGRMIFWKPVEVMMNSDSIISNQLLAGDMIHVVVDYEYDIKDSYDQANIGARVRQALTDEVIVGGTYVKENQESSDYELSGFDMKIHLGKDATVMAEYAQSQSEAEGSFVSTDGGITFIELSTDDSARGKAFGIKGDARLFNKIGLSAAYKYIDNNFSTSATSAQQGKEIFGFNAVYDVNESTRLTLSQDIQRLIEEGNLQTQLQVGATQTATTLVQLVHEARRLRLTAEYRHQDVTERLDQFDSQTNSEDDTLAVQVDYKLNDKIALKVKQQVGMSEDSTTQTTIGIVAKPTDKLVLSAEKTLGEGGVATSVDAKVDMNGLFTLTGDYSIKGEESGKYLSDTTTSASVGASKKISDLVELESKFGVIDILGEAETATVSLGGKSQVDEQTSIESSIALATSDDSQATTFSFGGSSQVDDKTKVESKISLTGADDGGTTTLTFGGTSQVDEKTRSQSSMSVTDSTSGEAVRAFNFGTTTKLTDDIQLASNQIFNTGQENRKTEDKYSLVRVKDGRKLEGSLSRVYSQNTDEISSSNIFGLTGDVDDKWALTGSFERGAIQKHDGAHSDRQAISIALGYVDKDQETGETLQSSTKVEVVLDDGDQDKRQYLVYHTTEGKLTSEWDIFSRLEYSKTRNLTAGVTEARHRKFILGGAFRPILHDRFNFLGRYTYLENKSPADQTDNADVEEEAAHVISTGIIYDINDQWRFSERFAYRIGKEKVVGFDFNKTHTWLMIHRLDYKISPNWMVGGEYRALTQREAKDSRRGLLIEVVRNINEYAQIGAGYNFTDFTDDLTDLDYQRQGAFVRLTGKFYDQTPEEIERAKQKWIEEKIKRWAWVMVSDELQRDNSPILDELNHCFILAESAGQAGDYQEAHKIYLDIISAGQMMYEEAADYIRSQIVQERRWKDMSKQADQLIHKGQYEKAKKILEKILEEVYQGVLE
ncbi:MAG: DUF11 domain-containing protein [Candidatus Omnitrophica bacterium]|nr:DUF11 domain-containing protein [Candidatus Omnitrophota bacterium]